MSTIIERLLEDAEYIETYIGFTGSPDRIVRNLREAANEIAALKSRIEIPATRKANP